MKPDEFFFPKSLGEGWHWIYEHGPCKGITPFSLWMDVEEILRPMTNQMTILEEIRDIDAI